MRADLATSKRALARVKNTTAFADAEAVEQTDQTKCRARRVGFFAVTAGAMKKSITSAPRPGLLAPSSSPCGGGGAQHDD
ncbi:MAG: hypothetical protein WAL59_20220, partial [Roseiarcus sp.]